MDHARRRALHALSFFFSLPFGIVAVMVRFGPATVDRVYPPWFGVWALPFAAAAVLAGYALVRLSFAAEKIPFFVVSLAASSGTLILASILAGTLIHRDFFSAMFQYILSLPALLIVFILIKRSAAVPKPALRSISRAMYVLAAFYAEWIMMMGYSIASRAEPRPVEALIYNAYNLLLTLLLFFAARIASKISHRTIETGRNTLSINGKEVSSMVGAKKTLLVYALAAAPERRLSCPEIQRILHGDKINARSDCADCAEESRKAAMCSRYRTTYNAILETKKLLEFLEVGTITSGDNRRNILQDGWKLALFEDVKLEIKK